MPEFFLEENICETQSTYLFMYLNNNFINFIVYAFSLYNLKFTQK